MTRGLLLYDVGNRRSVLYFSLSSFYTGFGWVHMGYHDIDPGAPSDSAAAACNVEINCNFNEHEEKPGGWK
jgi:hypothetical protein